MSGPVLPEELLVEILSRLPVKDLMRFRCVSKSWNSLIFDPSLVKLHLQRSPKNSNILLTFKDKYNYCTAPCSIQGLLENPLSTLNDCHPLKHDYISVWGVCNGLVCLSNYYHGDDDCLEYRFRLWNPATRVMSENSPPICFCLNDYDHLCYYMFGFGYNCWSDTYHVVVLDNKPQKMEVRVHCFGHTSWRNILTCPSFPTRAMLGASVSGTLNWLALPNLKSSYRWKDFTTDELVIFSYDLKNEIYSYLSMPDSFSEGPCNVPQLEVLKGSLCLAHCDRRNHFVVWLMREFGVQNSWTQLLNVSYEHLVDDHLHDRVLCFLAILCMSENDDVMLLANNGSAELLLYNNRDNRIDRCESEDFNNGEDFNYGHFSSYDYVESLVLPYRN